MVLPTRRDVSRRRASSASSPTAATRPASAPTTSRSARSGPDAIRLPGTVAVTEITGSESFVHVEYAGLRFVALTAGVHEVEPGAAIDTFVDPARLFVFAADGRLAAAPPRALAA